MKKKWSQRGGVRLEKSNPLKIDTSRFNPYSLEALILGYHKLKKNLGKEYLGKGFRIKKNFVKRSIEHIERIIYFIYGTFKFQFQATPSQDYKGYMDLAGTLITKEILLNLQDEPLQDLQQKIAAWQKESVVRQRQDMMALLLKTLPSLRNLSREAHVEIADLYYKNLIEDGKKEYSTTMQTGYENSNDFTNAHGAWYTQDLIKELKKQRLDLTNTLASRS